MKKSLMGLILGLFAVTQSYAEVAYVNDAKIDQKRRPKRPATYFWAPKRPRSGK